MPRDHRNNYAVFLNGRYQFEVRGHANALAERHRSLRRYTYNCPRSLSPSPCILDTPAVSQCCGCSDYCTATISREVSK